MATSPATDIRTVAALPLDGILLAEELLDLAERAQAYTNAAGVAIALLRGHELLVRTSTGSAPEVGTVLPVSDGFIAECLNRRRPVCCRDTETDSRIGPALRAMKTRSLIAIPIPGHPHARGAMVVIAPLPNAFQPTHTAILMTLSDIISSKLAARESPPDVRLEIVDDPPPAIAVVPEPATITAPSPKPAIAPTPVAVRTPAATTVAVEMKVEPPAPPALEMKVEPPAPSVPTEANAKTDDPSAVVPPATPAEAAIVVPPALLKVAPLPLVEDKKVTLDPGLLHPAEDPLRFATKKPVAEPKTTAPALVKIAPKPPQTIAIASAPSPQPKAASQQLSLPTLERQERAFTSISGAPAPAIATWELSHQPADLRRFVRPAMVAAAVLVVAVFLWVRHSSPDVTPPAIPVPSAAALPLPASPELTPAPTTKPIAAPASSATVIVKAAEEHSQTKASKAVEAKTPAPVETKQEPVRSVMEIPAAQPTPKPEPAPDVPAPKLALAVNNDAASIANLSKLPVAMPAPPKSELVPPTLVSQTAPVYPIMARQLGVYGVVTMDVTIGTDGHVKAVKVVDGAMQLRLAATDAVRQWRYKPAMLNHKPVESTAKVQVNFTR